MHPGLLRKPRTPDPPSHRQFQPAGQTLVCQTHERTNGYFSYSLWSSSRERIWSHQYLYPIVYIIDTSVTTHTTIAIFTDPTAWKCPEGIGYSSRPECRLTPPTRTSRPHCHLVLTHSRQRSRINSRHFYTARRLPPPVHLNGVQIPQRDSARCSDSIFTAG